MTDEPLPPAVWADEGARIAWALQDVAAAIVTGRDPEAIAAVALGIARAHAPGRRVAVADLIGGVALLTPQDDQPGLLECLRDGEPISGIGQPLPGTPEVYVLPSGRGPIAERWVFESARWERLVAGFREVDALLLLVARANAPGLSALIARVDGVVAVDLPPADVRSWPLVATVDHPEPELPPILVRRPPLDGAFEGRTIPVARAIRGQGRYILGGLALVAASIGGGTWWTRSRPASMAARVEARAEAPVEQPVEAPVEAPVEGAAAGGAAEGGAAWALAVVTDSRAADSLRPGSLPLPPTAELVEVTLGPLVNPLDSAIAAGFAVELVAANTLPSANSRLASLAIPAPAMTIAPVVIGTAARPWFHALVGAWTERRDAEAWLAAQRATRVLAATAGRVVTVPYALLLEDSLAPREAAAVVLRWESVGIRAYRLVQDDGRVRVFAGAFESASHAAWFASMLREMGATPLLAYRTGRAF